MSSLFLKNIFQMERKIKVAGFLQPGATPPESVQRSSVHQLTTGRVSASRAERDLGFESRGLKWGGGRKFPAVVLGRGG